MTISHTLTHKGVDLAISTAGGRLVVGVFCHEVRADKDLKPSTRLTLYWTGAVYGGYCVETFDKMRSLIFVREKLDYSLITIKGAVALNSGADSDLFEETFVLRNDASPIQIPQAISYLRLNFYGQRSGSKPEVEMVPVLTSSRESDVTFWGNAYVGPTPPSDSNDLVGVHSIARDLWQFETRLVDYVERTQYSTVSRKEVEAALKQCWRALKIMEAG